MINHLIELRQRAILILICFAIFFGVFFFFANDLFHIFVSPLLRALPTGNALIATQITSPVLTPVALAANIALLCTAPYALWHMWRFIAPGLYTKERSIIKEIIITSLILFCLGILFCFYLILPFMFEFFAQAVPKDVKIMPDMANAIDFITRMLLLFGLCFQIPLICQTLVRIQWITIELLCQIRPYIIVAAFTIGMLFTPPDVMSQVMLAVPLCLLYELGILLARWKKPRQKNG